MGKDSHFQVYGDFNCPFCYALNERIHTLRLDDRVTWHSIEHMPEVISKNYTFASLSELTGEVTEVRRLSPGTEICTPAFRPNSAYASGLVAQASLVDLESCVKLRLLIYRALWIDGLDISDSDLIDSLLERCDLAGLQQDDKGLATQREWQQAWERDEYDRGVPIIITPKEEVIIGIPGQPGLDSILLGEKIAGEVLPGALCIMGPQQRILVIDKEAQHIRMLLEHMRNHQVLAVESLEQAEQYLQSDQPPDLLLVNQDAIGLENIEACHRAVALRDGSTLPMLLIGNGGVESEVTAFEAGAADFIPTPLHPKVLQVRVNTQLDIIRTKQLLERMARLDGLTEVPNRREFDIRLVSEWERALRTGTTLSVIMIDADHFKAFNDGYGHLRGDDCLRTLAKCLLQSLHRPSDLLARYGGEEFAAVLPETGKQGSMEVAERCMQLVNEVNIEHVHGGIMGRVTISIGVATAQPKRGGQAQTLLEAADGALYNAKKLGRNQICVAH